GPPKPRDQSRPNPNRKKRGGRKKPYSGKPKEDSQDMRKLDGSSPARPQNGTNRAQQASKEGVKKPDVDRNLPKKQSSRPDRSDDAAKEVKRAQTAHTKDLAHEGREPEKGRRQQRRRVKQDVSHFQAEETVEDIRRDITRIEKDIQIDLESIRNQKLDL
ncbi:MAG TPA: hypothetical protein VFD19_04850, partial [Clostridia bacterium]|nr:hypothetical protein [Clostridia bacterium]